MTEKPFLPLQPAEHTLVLTPPFGPGFLLRELIFVNSGAAADSRSPLKHREGSMALGFC
ncbi:hypothetical protein EMIT0P171_10249 [Pseudomonas sp. IT-P171]